MVDEKDLRIIEILQKDARTTYTEIAKRLRVSESTIRKRVKQLEDDGIIKGYTINVDPTKLGYNTVTILGLDVEPSKFLEAARKITELPQVKSVSTSTGDHMIMAEIWTEDGNELTRLISNEIGRIDGVKRLCPAILLEKLKG